jgi:membrane protein DedA with SNARE-associated domain
MDAVRPFLELLGQHTFTLIFFVTLIDSFGLPFPGRLLLIVSGAFMESGADAAALIALAAAGALVGDHGVYLAGQLAGDRVLGLFCRLTLNSEGCLDRTREYFRRFGGPTFILGRFVAGIRIVAIALAGAGLVRYRTFIAYDVVGALVWATACVSLGYSVRDHLTAFVEDYGGAPMLVALLIGGTLVAVASRVVWCAGARRARAVR